jgi:hypothetical protein
MGLLTQTNLPRNKRSEQIVKILCAATENSKITVFCKNEITKIETEAYYGIIAEEFGLLDAMKNIEFKCLDKLKENQPTITLLSKNE